MVENLRKIQELKAEILAQDKLAETFKKLSDFAGDNYHCSAVLFYKYFFYMFTTLTLG